MNNFIKDANWRYATKKFDSSKKIPKEDLETLKEAIKLSASSYGLQPYKVLIIEDPEVRAKLQPAAWGQSQIIDSSHVLVFANIINLSDNEIDEHINNITKSRELPAGALKGYGDFMKSKITTLPVELRDSWTSKQCYLALGNLLNAAAELKIDATPMEGFEKDKVNEILNLKKIGLSASLIATIGYRHEDDTTQHYTKTRKSNEELFINL